MAFAQSEFTLSEPQDDGIPLRVHLDSISRQTGVRHEMLENAPRIPELLAHVWRYYCEIRAQNKGKEPITAQSVRDFCWFHGVELTLFERAAFKRLDVEYLTR